MLPKADGKERLPFGVTEGTNFYDWKDRDNFLSVRNAELSRYTADQSGCFDADSYYFQEKALVVKMKSRTHETVHVTFSAILFGKLNGMKTRSKLRGIGAATTKTNGRNKEPDQSYLPISLPKGRSRQWPSLTVEVGVSESTTKLANDAHWWLTESAGDVKIVITIFVRKVTKNITFEVWNLVPGPDESMCPRVTYRTVVSQKADTDDIEISNEMPMTIPFESLFLRSGEGPIEGDINFDKDDLKEIAISIWDEH